MIWNEHHHAWIVSDYYRLLLEQFQNPEKSSPKICKVPVQLIERESVCNFRKELP